MRYTNTIIIFTEYQYRAWLTSDESVDNTLAIVHLNTFRLTVHLLNFFPSPAGQSPLAPKATIDIKLSYCYIIDKYHGHAQYSSTTQLMQVAKNLLYSL